MCFIDCQAIRRAELAYDCGSSASSTATTLLILHYVRRLGIKTQDYLHRQVNLEINSDYSPQSDSERRRSPPYPSRTL